MTPYIFTENEQDQEFRRLQLLEQAFDEKTKETIQNTGIGLGWKCLEIGAGAGSILQWLSELVGPNGLVVGLDKNTTYLQHLHEPQIKIIEGLIQEFDLDEQFDVIHARYVFVHNLDSYKLIAQIGKLLKPGGRLILEEPDFTTARWIDPQYAESGNRVNRAMNAMFRNMGLNPAFGSEMPVELPRHGLEIVSLHGDMHLCKGTSPVAQVMAASTKVLQQRYIETGMVDEQDIVKYIEGTDDSRSLAIYYSTISCVCQKNAEQVIPER